MMMSDDDESEKTDLSEDAVDELLDTEEDEEDFEDEDLKDTVDEFGASKEEDGRSRDWE